MLKLKFKLKPQKAMFPPFLFKKGVIAIANKLWEDGIRGVEFRNDESADLGGRDLAYSIGHLTQYFGNGTVASEGK